MTKKDKRKAIKAIQLIGLNWDTVFFALSFFSMERLPFILLLLRAASAYDS